MIKNLFLFKLNFWLHILRLAALAFVGGMVLIQIPELTYDFGSKKPEPVVGLDELFDHLLQYYEGLSRLFTGASFGCVIIQRKEFDKGTIPESEP